jgi:hypothetical protein
LGWFELFNTNSRSGPIGFAQDSSEIEPTDSGLTTEVCEVTDLVDLAPWPEGTRLIIRRQPKHPGAQTTLLPDLDYRFWGHYTNCDGDPVELDRKMRAHAHVEDHIPAVKASVGDPCRFHDMRHTHAALLIAVNTHPKLLQSRLGHSSIKTTLDIYGHLYEPLDEFAADRLEELVLGAIAHETRTERASGL